MACAHGNSPIIKLLLKAGANSEEEIAFFQQKNHTKILRLLSPEVYAKKDEEERRKYILVGVCVCIAVGVAMYFGGKNKTQGR